jgi:sterol desaturase/sphingolipid hydroxylase (fatty acid hydroxylase superfamily)
LDLLVYAAPAFLLLSGLEAFALRRRGRPVRFADFASGLGCSILDQLVNAPTVVVFLAAYGAVQARHAVFPWPAGAAGWIAAVLLHDIAYYAFHVASHRINVLWAAHVVHHQGEDYNFDVSWRQGAVATWVTYAFYLPLAWIGVPIQTFVVVHGVYQIHQFLVHTELVGRLGPIEWIVATPRIHRLHHGRDPEHLDRNYGGFLCVWDRLFGTLAREGTRPDYGVTEGLASWSPFHANVHLFGRLWRESGQARGLRAKARVWLGPPSGLRPAKRIARYDARPAPGPLPAALLAVSLVLAFVALGAGDLPLAAVRLPAGVASLAALAGLSARLDGTRS